MQPDLSWVGVLEHHALRTPDKPLAVHGGDVVTYRQMQDRAAALATGLQDLGVAVGDVVGLLSYTSLEFLEVIFAANHLGAIAMPINWRLAAAEVAYILEHSQARVFVCDEELLELGTDAADRLDDGPVRVADLVGALGRTKLSQLSPTRSQLIGKGLVYAPDRGEVAFTVPGMGAFARRQVVD